ncbi:gephyrin-like molybdotransferase Glp [Cohnella zeiphila]|uniref:Molybdopterin molybdenumtransferase n=1 Tax=Cohnella zeiphila TaxID=2761120 RepID=A0A7X0VUH9_9BACL|nr:gephyrin-like molybdotransferase Glp [Cohnella zeiphila]MBB6731034.1 molybdopterin molybdotransferase MoeA [Cohnella zeiphila]
MAAIQEAEAALAATVEDAVERLCRQAGDLSAETVPLPEAAGRYLAQDCASPIPIPPFRRAAMDGYAVRAADTAEASPERPVRLTVAAEVRAGEKAWFPAPPEKGSAVRVFTGSPVPEAFDSVVMQETVVRYEEGMRPFVRLDRPAPSGRHIAEAGEDCAAGAVLLKRGTALGAKEIAVLASFGIDRAAVYRRPSVVVLPIGDELELPGRPLPPSRVYEANGFMTEAKLRLLGADVRRLPPMPDHPAMIGRCLEQAWEEADLVVTTGGASVGKYDYVKWAAETAGAEPLFKKVRMRPGTPTSAYVRGGKTLISLSGNPSACFAGLELLVKPYVWSRMGRLNPRNDWREGRLAAAVEKPCPYPRYIRSRAWMENGEWRLLPLANDRSGNIAAFAEADALAVVPAGGGGADAGQTVRWFSLVEQ